MRRYWLVFSQAVTVVLAAYFVLTTLKPEWVGRNSTLGTTGISLIEAPASPPTAPGLFSTTQTPITRLCSSGTRASSRTRSAMCSRL